MRNGERIGLLSVSGFLAGLLVWHSFYRTSLLMAITTRPGGGYDEISTIRIVGAVIGLIFGIFLGTADSMTTRDRQTKINAICITIAGGVAAGLIANHLYPMTPLSPVVSLASPNRVIPIAPPTDIQTVFHALIAWGLFGGVLGGMPGLARRSSLVGIIGTAGGIVGGAIGGSFASIAQSTWEATNGAHPGIALPLAYACAGLLIAALATSASTLFVREHPPTKGSAREEAEQLYKSPDEKRIPPETASQKDLPQTTLASPSAGLLVCIDGPCYGKSCELKNNGKITIGRGEEQDFSIFKDGSASREHSVVIGENGKFQIMDIGSRNGTVINGTKLTKTPHALYPGDIIEIGQTRIVFQLIQKLPTGETKILR